MCCATSTASLLTLVPDASTAGVTPALFLKHCVVLAFGRVRRGLQDVIAQLISRLLESACVGASDTA
jgi:hypothetical protein